MVTNVYFCKLCKSLFYFFMRPVFPSSYFPSLEFFALLLRYPAAELEVMDTYHRQSPRNRCYIYGPNGLQRLVIPVIHPAKADNKVCDILTDTSSNWRQIHWRSFSTAYNKSPFFEYYAPELESVFMKPTTGLANMNLALIQFCLYLLKCNTDVRLTESYRKDLPLELDFRERLLAKHATSPACFPRYSQVFEPAHGFIPNLSVLDLLFNRGNDARPYLERLALL